MTIARGRLSYLLAQAELAVAREMADDTESGRRYAAENDCKLLHICRILSRTKSHHSHTDRVFAEYSRVSIRKLSRIGRKLSRIDRKLSRIGRILSRIRKLS